MSNQQTQYFPCYLCGKPTSEEPLEVHGIVYHFCPGCKPDETVGAEGNNNIWMEYLQTRKDVVAVNAESEHQKHMQVPLPIEIEVIPDTLYLPSIEEFKDFYAELNTIGMSLIEAGNGTITITTSSGTKAVFGIRGIAELVADKLKMPTPINTDQELTFIGKPNFVENVDALLKNKMEWVQVEFHNLFEFNDPRIEKLCQDYHKTRSIPIIALAEYLKWEREYLNYRIQAETVIIQDQKTIEVREIRNEYKKKLDEDKAKLIKRAEYAENNLSKLRQASDRDMNLYMSLKGEHDNQKGEVEEQHRKLTDSNAKNMRMEEDLRITRTELEKFKDKVKKTDGDEWSIDFTSTDDKPAFCGKATGEVITFPCSMARFRQNYNLQKERTETGERVFKDESGAEIKIPESLAKAIPDLVKEKQDTGKDVPEIESGLTPNDKKVLKATKDLPLTVNEIAAITKIRNKEISSRHIPNLIKRGYIEEIKENGEVKYQPKEKEE